MFGIFSADIVKGLVGTPGERSHLVHGFDDVVSHSQVVGVGSFAALEEDVRVLSGSPEFGVLRVDAGRKAATAHVYQLGHLVVVEKLDLLVLVGGSETIEKVEEGNGS